MIRRRLLFSTWIPFLFALATDVAMRGFIYLSNALILTLLQLLNPILSHAETNGGIETHEIISNLSGSALAVAVMMYMIHYFMKREERRENFISTIIEKNTQATNMNTQLMIEIKEVMRVQKEKK